VPANTLQEFKVVTPARNRSLNLSALLIIASVLGSLCASAGHTQLLPDNPLRPALAPTTSPATNLVTNTPAQPSERNASDIQAQQQEMQTRLTATQADLVKAQNAFNEVSALDPVARATAKEHLEHLSQQNDAYIQIVDNLKNLRRLSDKLANARNERLAWKPPSGSAPWPIAVADDLYFEIMRGQAQIQHLAQRHAMMTEQLSELKKSRIAVEAELRQNIPRPLGLTTLATQAGHLQSATERRLARINLELINVSVDSDAILIEQNTAVLVLASLKQTWDFYQHRFSFSAADFKKTSLGIEKTIEQLRSQERQASSRINRTLEQATLAKARLDQLDRTPNVNTDLVTAARRSWRTADVLAEASLIDREKYRAQIDLNLLSLQFWEMRQKLYSNTDIASDLGDMTLRQQTLNKQLAQGLAYLTQISADKSQAAFDLTTQLQEATDPAEKAFLNGLLAPIAQQIDTTRNLYVLIGRVHQYLQIVGAELEYADTKKTLIQRLKIARTVVMEFGKDIWYYELFVIDDAILVDGREIKTKRGITIGKTAGAIIILVFGFSLISGLIRRTVALAVNKANLGLSKSVALGRWLTLIAGFTLIVTALNLVDIPLSAFAFLGGALAIGVGFGTQNILKNLISGVMLLVEKPIRIGDVVEIDSILGTVTSIGLRFSTVHGPQGNDILIPNSVLVEQKLINWTYSTPSARKDVRVTVGYRSNVAAVREILIAISKDDPNVLGTPAALITLEEFGDNGLVFNLRFWVSLQSIVPVNEIQSDLRIKILQAFEQAGIELPFPQRTVVFDPETPLAVHLQSGPPANPNTL
jgi:small-conductance mechanosensitive channel